MAIYALRPSGAQGKAWTIELVSHTVDQSFVRGLCLRAQNDAIIGLADNLGLKTIAEGVETPAELARLRELGCAEVQGYLTGRPVDARTFERGLAAGGSTLIPLRAQGTHQ